MVKIMNYQRLVLFSKLFNTTNTINLIRSTGVSWQVLGQPIQCNRRFIATKTPKRERTLIGKLVERISLPSILKKNRLAASGYFLYESIADKINYADLIERLSLPDTFYSWYVITELHLWMVMVRLMAEGDEGRLIRNSLVEALWSDVTQRSKKVGIVNPYGMRHQISELSQQFNAAIIAYDEGLLCDDVVLAGALWRRVYQQDCSNVDHLNSLVKYVRRQVKVLDGLTKPQITKNPAIPWVPFTNR